MRFNFRLFWFLLLNIIHDPLPIANICEYLMKINLLVVLHSFNQFWFVVSPNYFVFSIRLLAKVKHGITIYVTKYNLLRLQWSRYLFFFRFAHFLVDIDGYVIVNSFILIIGTYKMGQLESVSPFFPIPWIYHPLSFWLLCVLIRHWFPIYLRICFRFSFRLILNSFFWFNVIDDRIRLKQISRFWMVVAA